MTDFVSYISYCMFCTYIKLEGHGGPVIETFSSLFLIGKPSFTGPPTRNITKSSSDARMVPTLGVVGTAGRGSEIDGTDLGAGTLEKSCCGLRGGYYF
jgi:hypothetical protein